MTPIVSPWLLYLIGLCDRIHNCIFVVEAILVLAIFLTIACMVNPYDGEDTSKYNRNLKIFIVSFIVLGVINCIVPSQETALQMLAASVVTPDNIQAVQGNIVDFISEVAKAIKQ